MDICHIDLETYSEIDLKKSGVYRYSAHDSTEILCAMFCFGSGLVHGWIPHVEEQMPFELAEEIKDYFRSKEELGAVYFSEITPYELRDYVKAGKQLRAHNAMFERKILNGVAGKRLGFPPTEINQWVCTAAKASAHSLPRALKDLAIAIDAKHKKDEEGRRDMLALCKPKKPSKKDPSTRYSMFDYPEKYFNNYCYCADDVLTERDCDDYIPDLPKRSQKIWELDQKINDRGVKADLKSVDNVMYLVDLYKKELEEESIKLTGFKPTQNMKLADWIRENGYPQLKDLQAPTIKKILKDEKVPKLIRRVANIRATHSMKAVTKYPPITRSYDERERLCGMFLYHGASTGRWSSKIVQLQNLFRSVIKDPELAIDLFAYRDPDVIKMLYEENPMRVFASSVRGMLVADEGKDLICSDYNSIEARIGAWLAGQEDKLEVFRTHGKAYEHTAAKIYGMYGTNPSVDQLKRLKKEYPEERFVGKTADLALLYQGGRKALMGMAETFGVIIDEDRAENIKNDWRNAHIDIVNLWYALQNAAYSAIAIPGKAFKSNRISFKVIGDFLYMRLPSARRIAYYKPAINSLGEITFLGVDTYSGKWKRCKTYGGKITENACQGIAADVIMDAMPLLEEAKYPTIGTVHDEIWAEVDEGFGSPEDMSHIMCTPMSWHDGLPLAADGFRAKRYRKD